MTMTLNSMKVTEVIFLLLYVGLLNCYSKRCRLSNFPYLINSSLSVVRARRVLVWSDLDMPRSIAVEPSESGLMFWSDWGSRQPKIEAASMDGSNRRILVDRNIVWPNGITLDKATKRLFWLEAKTNRIRYSN